MEGLTIEVPAADAPPLKEEWRVGGSEPPPQSLSLEGRPGGAGEPAAPASGEPADAPAPESQLADATPDAAPTLAAAGPSGGAAPPRDGTTPEAPPAAAPGPGPGPGGGEEDELAASLLSNMAAWQTELDTFQVALRQCMESRPVPGAHGGSPSTVDESGRGAARLLHSGPKGITGFRGVTQHKRTKRYEANVWMDHKQMYLGAFDAPEQAAHAHDIGALCSGKARAEALNFPLTDYDTLLPMLYSLPHAQVVAALRGYGRLPTARPPGGISSGRLHTSPGSRAGSTARRNRSQRDTDDSDDDGEERPPKQRPRRQRKASASPGGRAAALPPRPPAPAVDWQAALSLPPALMQPLPGGSGAKPEGQQGLAGWPGVPPPEAAAAQQAHLQALSAALLGGGPGEDAVPRPPTAQSGAADPQQQQPPAAPDPLPPLPRPSSSTLLPPLASSPGLSSEPPAGSFEAALWDTMARSHKLERPEGSQQGVAAPRPLHSGPKGQSGFKGVTLYKRCQRYNAHIWLGKQTHIGTFHTAAQAAVAHDVMELWRNEAATGLNFAASSYTQLLPLLTSLSEADALTALRTYSRSPAAAAAAAAAGAALAPPLRMRQPGLQARQPSLSAATSARAAPAAAAASAVPVQPPSLRRRHRKPQHGGGGGGGSGGRSDDSSFGSVPAQRQSAGSLMWYMLEQEKSADEEEELAGDEEDSDFSPEGEEVEVQQQHQQQASKRQRQGSDSPTSEPLSFHPRATASLAAALSAPLPEGQPVQGARPPRPGSSHRWGVAVSMRGQAAWFGRLDRRRAAVAADLVLLWRRRCAAAAGEHDDKDAGTAFNLPAAGYELDLPLLEQLRRAPPGMACLQRGPGRRPGILRLRRIKSSTQLCQFLAAVIPQDPPAPPGGAAAAAAAAAALVTVPGGLPVEEAVPALLMGARKRKQQALLEGASSGQQQRNGGDAAAASPQGGAAANGASQVRVPGLLDQVALALQQADACDPASMLSALRLLVAAGQGGRLLREVVEGWAGYDLMRQQDLFAALKAPVAAGEWDMLDERLQLSLDLASLW